MTPPSVLALLTDALIDAEWLAQGETAEPQDAQFALGKLNDIIDAWSADEHYVPSKRFDLFTLTPGLSPHTIGPSGVLVLPQRPVRIEGCTIVLQNAGGTTTDIPVNTTRDAAWWNSVRIKNLQSQIPTDLYYQPDLPNGSMFFWPVPDFAYQTRVESWNALQPVTSFGQQLVLPPAYRKALRLTLASELDGPKSAALVGKATEACYILWSNNVESPTMSTMAAGMPSSSAHTRFNFLDGTPW